MAITAQICALINKLMSKRIVTHVEEQCLGQRLDK
jgi:hypothetical protein